MTQTQEIITCRVSKIHEWLQVMQGWGGSCRGEVDHVAVRWGGSYRGGVGHVGVGHVGGMGWVM